MRVQIGKGVLAKDNKTPYAPGTLHATNVAGWHSPYAFNWVSFGKLMAHPDIIEIQVIDHDNNEVTFTKTLDAATKRRVRDARVEFAVSFGQERSAG